MATGLGEVAAPGVQAVAGDQEAVERRTARGREVEASEPLPDSGRQLPHVLGVGEDRHVFVGVVCGDALEPFEHLVARDPQCGHRGAGGQIGPGENRAPGGVGVEDRAHRGDKLGDRAVEERLGRTAAVGAVGQAATGIDANEVVAGKGRLILPAGGHEQFKRLAGDDHAVVAARAERPAAAVEFAANGPQGVERVGGGRAGERCHARNLRNPWGPPQ